MERAPRGDIPHSRKLSMKARRQFWRSIGIHVVVGGDDRAQICAERDPDGRTVVDGANAHLERAVSGTLGLLGKAVHEVGMDVALAQHAGAFGGDAEKVARARLVDLREGAEDRRNQDRAAVMRLGGLPRAASDPA